MTTGYLISIHDVMPESLTSVERIVARLERENLGPATLLVVPGRDWEARDIDVLGRFAGAGYELAGHGWRHEIERIGGVRHWLHAVTISRNVAEHLQFDARGIAALIRDCRAWFDACSLPPPSMYVPPAWAMGPIPRSDLDGLGFRYYETLSGIYDSATREMYRLPLVGFEADTRFRARALRIFNSANRAFGRRKGPVRLSIHPQDFELLLGDDLDRLLAECPRATTLEALA